MMYRYTWNHLRLFAQICNCDETNDNITENWVKMLESHHEETFPFTLWPLTYRTCAVIASPSLQSPCVKSIHTSEECHVVVKFYRSNDVIIICFQHVGNHDKSCMELCKFKIDAVVNGHGQHSSDHHSPLVECEHICTYAMIKKKVMIELMKCRQQGNEADNVSCIICLGYNIGAVLACFMASDLAKEFQMEAEFMSFNKPAITVDCVSFSLPNIANETYWTQFDQIVDGQIKVKHRNEYLSTTQEAHVIVGDPFPDTTNNDKPNKVNKIDTFRQLGQLGQLGNSEKWGLFHKTDKKKKHNDKIKRVSNVPCQTYVEDIAKMIVVGDDPGH